MGQSPYDSIWTPFGRPLWKATCPQNQLVPRRTHNPCLAILLPPECCPQTCPPEPCCLGSFVRVSCFFEFVLDFWVRFGGFWPRGGRNRVDASQICSNQSLFSQKEPSGPEMEGRGADGFPIQCGWRRAGGGSGQLQLAKAAVEGCRLVRAGRRAASSRLAHHSTALTHSRGVA